MSGFPPGAEGASGGVFFGVDVPGTGGSPNVGIGAGSTADEARAEAVGAAPLAVAGVLASAVALAVGGVAAVAVALTRGSVGVGLRSWPSADATLAIAGDCS
jgi:hypothetical protein